MTNDTTAGFEMPESLTSSILRPYIPEYCVYLERHRYRVATRRSYLRCIAHFGRWIHSNNLSLEALDGETIRRFTRGHLERCDCPGPIHRSIHENRAALKHLIPILQASGRVPLPETVRDPIENELALFDAYMDRTCGLAFNTRYQRVRMVRKLLAGLLNCADVWHITPDDVRRFIAAAPRKQNAGTIHVMAGALRCYLRFRVIDGRPIEPSVSVPTSAHWRLAGIPETLGNAEIEEFLQSFRHLAHSPKRAYAMARCLTDLGLRASEVARLRLEDIDWRAGTVRLASTKSRRFDFVPLPRATGAAIADYLCAERPQSSNRALFVRHVAPCDKAIGPGVVRRIVREAYLRCGWSHTRVHILRHSAASRLLASGAPLKEIADVLRHRSFDTSAIYAKVDIKRLSAVALPWTGRQS